MTDPAQRPALPANPLTPVQQPLPAIRITPTRAPVKHTALLAVDITAFGSRYRDPHDQITIRSILYQHLADAFTMTGLPWWECHREDRGDGTLIVTPTTTDPYALLDPLAHHLRALLRATNRRTIHPAPLQLRTAVHYGQVHHDAHGVTGGDLIHLFRLLESTAFKRALKQHPTPLGMIVSDTLYSQALNHSPYLNPASYQPLRITRKETRAQAWIWGTG